ncbi:unnamed protein product [Taenia asiatica]|uniref:ubiquitinyl hydrolase 1 n=1 Tax=Taenia asiatica TaxID=60517 RepID=A0A0R3W4X4_TAEAS|nr:unnamed protein product [Taenia asiatica]
MYKQPSKEKRGQNSSIESASSCGESEEFQLFIRDNTSPYPPGLTNLGNTCYINATLQCLLTIQPLVDWLISQSEKYCYQSLKPEGPLLTPILSKLVVAIFRKDYSLELEEFRRVIGELVKHHIDCNTSSPAMQDFKEPREQDAQEFLLFLLNQLHDETVGNPTGRGPATSEILRIFEGTLQTQLSYPQRNRCWKNLYMRPFSNEPKGNSEVFLSLSVPIPVPGNQLKAATDLLDSNACDLNIVFNEIREDDSSICFRRLLKVHPSTDIQSVYNQVFSFPSIGSSITPSATSLALRSSHTTGSGSHRNSKESTHEDFLPSSPSILDPFILVQESSGRAVDLTDGLNMEDNFFTSSQVVTATVKRSLLNGDALFIVRLNSKPSSEEPQLTSSSFSLNRTVISGVEAGKQAVESRMQLLLVHVEERESHKLFHIPSDDNNATRAANFRRFSPPLSVNVPNDIRFDNLRFLALQSLLVCCGNCPPTESMLTSETYRNVCFWVVDAAPGWLSTEKGDSPRLLRLLVVWPSPPVDPLRTFKVDTDLPLREFLIDPNVTSDCNSRFARANTFEESELTIRKCLEEFIKKANVTRAHPRNHCEKQQTTVELTTWLEKAPKYLILHLNRFVHMPESSGGNGLMKINSLVKYPTSDLDLSFMFGQSISKGSKRNKNSSNSDLGKPVYDLVAVCNHKGSIETGHITAYCKSLVSGQWWHYNDLKVQKVSPDQVVQPGAYILFYKKRDADVGDIRKTVAKLFEISKERRDRDVASNSPSSAASHTGKRTSTTRPCTLTNWLSKRSRR